MKTRLHFLDALRGFLLVEMIAYHGLWNLCHLYGVRLPWYTGTAGYVWQQSICWLFILLAGFCFGLGRNHWKRGGMIFAGGLIVSLVTHLCMPASSITFGILTFTGSAVLLTALVEKGVKKVPAVPGLLASSMIFCLLRNVGRGSLGFESMTLGRIPAGWYRDLLTAYLGFPPDSFRSSDYFPLIPWLFLFFCGYFLFRILRSRGWDARLLSRGNVPVLNVLGRHSLIVYLLHQPILYAAMELWFL